MKICETHIFWNYHCRAVALAVNLILWSGNRHWKRHQLLIALSRVLKYIDDVELVFPSDEFQVCSIFNMLTRNEDKPWMPLANRKLGFFFFFFLWMYNRSNKLETHQILLVIFCVKKDQFWFLLMLRTSLAEVRQTKICTEMQIAQPLRQLQRWEIFTVSTFCKKASMWIVLYCRRKSGSKLGWTNKNWCWAQDKNKICLITYFVRTGNPSYLGTKQVNFSPQKLLNMGSQSCMVLRLTLRHSLAKPPSYPQSHQSTKFEPKVCTRNHLCASSQLLEKG